MEELRTLVVRTCSGDLEAFGQIVRRFQDMACGYAYSILGDFHLAEDVAQEAFLEAYRQIRNLRNPDAFPGWFRRIVFKYCDRMTRRKGVQTVNLHEAVGMSADDVGPSEISEEYEMQEKVLEAIKALPEHQRTATTLFYINGYSQKEVAEFLEVPVTTVKGRLHRGRNKLKKGLMRMLEEVLKGNAPDDSFAERVRKAIEVYSSKGPSEDSTGSEWDCRLKQQTGELLRSGEEGFRIAVELSQSAQAKARSHAAIYFGLTRNPLGKRHLERLMKDKAIRVRNRAVRAYALLIHPNKYVTEFWDIGKPAKSVPDGIEELFPLLDDDNVKIRIHVVWALGAYAGLSDHKVKKALEIALSDSKHSVRHRAARVLGIDCPGCGTKPK